MEEIIQVADQWYVLATSSRADDRTRVLKDGETFGVFDRYGDIQPVGLGEQGLYHDGTRHVSRLELRVDGLRPLLLNSTVREDNLLLAVDLTTPDLHRDGVLVLRKDVLHLFRARLLWDAVLYEHLRLTNYGTVPITLALEILVDADFADIFEVRGVRRVRHGVRRPPVAAGEGEWLWRYEGLDGRERATRVRIEPAAEAVGPGTLRRVVSLGPRGQVNLFLTIACEADGVRARIRRYDEAWRSATAALAAARAETATVYTSNEQVNRWFHRSSADVHMLVAHTPQGPYPHAGVPWFSTVFGRDGIITAFELLAVWPELARGVLGFLAVHQAAVENPEQDAEPGKILHELRGGEMAALGEVPFGRYYGSVDSTPLFVMLAGAYYERTGDRAFAETLWPNIERALAWIDRYGDRDGDGFVEYARHSRTGLVHQGWKDSRDAVAHADGAPAEPPIALCEVQGYVYAARRAAARLARRLGREDRAAVLEAQAAALRRQFNDVFWCEDLGCYALALDGAKRPCRVRSSNAGHALWTGIAEMPHARRLAETLLGEPMFTGWGIRTLAEGERCYNPMSYHNGSVWPHDNALIAAGLARAGFKEQVLRVFTGLLDASIFMDLNRLPELFCGFPRLPGQGPTLYPLACAPQAWASGAPFLLLQAMLGLRFSAEKPQLRFHHPRLPESLERVRLTNLRVGSAVVDLLFTRHHHDVGINVTRKHGDIEIAVIV